ncbi:MAG: protein-methionine-sulfoxide reductase catalytic subunit MsrP [Alphaproteobacteria bacterium]|nr:protein-methionine-sulfoxide reductase catalytic subunit MsrP [Alphaproteobacteria bacterium]
MLIKRRRGWELPESSATPESVYLNRRAVLAGMGIAGIGLSLPSLALAQAGAARNDRYKLDRPITPEKLSTTYNNFYEFGDSKNIWSTAKDRLKTRPWTIKIEGMVDKPIEIGIDDLIAKMPMEERLYRHRCVEAWSMNVPYTGFALSALIDMAKPQSGAKYLIMQTLADPRMFPGQREFYYPWPYTEGLTMAEARHELSFIATGLYGKPLPAANGAPLRLATPWKYGFKHVKSISRLEFSDKRPQTFWEKLGPDEYGFWANVNPQVAHPRWSQATEKPLGSDERIPTQLYNGYAEFVAPLYADLKNEKLFM